MIRLIYRLYYTMNEEIVGRLGLTRLQLSHLCVCRFRGRQIDRTDHNYSSRSELSLRMGFPVAVTAAAESWSQTLPATM